MPEFNSLKILKDRLLKIAGLNLDVLKRDTVSDLFSRYTSELEDSLKNIKSEDEIKTHFNHYINNILSVVGTFAGNSFKDMRKLMMQEIHGAKEYCISEYKSKNPS